MKGRTGLIYTDLIFVFAFLPIYAVFHYCSSEGWSKNAFSLLASLIFLMWGGGVYYPLLALAALAVYFCGRLVKKSPVFEVLGSAAAAVSGSAAAIFLPNRGSLENALLSVGLTLFILRSAWYLRDVSRGSEPETDWLSLAVYLLSFENMLAAPLFSYDELRSSVKNRRPVLARSSAGLALIIKGLGIAGICGLSFDAVRLAATEYEAFPWLNAVTLFLATVGEAYVVVAGTLDISRGISLLEGYAIKPETPAFMPKTSLSGHLGELWQGFEKALDGCFSERSAPGFWGYWAALLAMSGVFIAAGAGAAGAFGLILTGAAALKRLKKLHPAVGALLGAAVMTAAFLLLAFGSPAGIAKAFSALDPGRYGYDVTYILNYELRRRLPWLAVGLIAVSPLRRIAGGALRRKMSESGGSYLAIKIIDTAFCGVILVIFAAAALR